MGIISTAQRLTTSNVEAHKLLGLNVSLPPTAQRLTTSAVEAQMDKLTLSLDSNLLNA